MTEGIKGRSLARSVVAFIVKWRFDFAWFGAMALALWWLA